jgi:pimeloyl-ACP methyl ester carboxylesterase
MQTINKTAIYGYAARYLHIYNPRKPSLVFVPGAFMDFDSLKYHSSRFSEHFNYFILELPGTGDLPPLPANKPVSFLGDCLGAFARKYIGQPFYLVACSYGTASALDFASRYSEQIKRLVLAGSMRTISDTDWPRMLNLAMQGLTDQSLFAEHFVQLVCRHDRCCSKRQQTIRKAILRSLRQFSPEKRRCFTNNTLRLLTAFTPDVEQIHCPTLCFTGEHDPYTTPELCQELANAIPFGEFATLEDTDHLFHIDKPQESMDLAIKFLTADCKVPLKQAA